jgi:hypothetical protein
MIKLYTLAPDPVGRYCPTGGVVAWSWLIGAAVAWLVSSLAGWSLISAGGSVGLAILADFPVSALACAIAPAVLTWRWASSAW